MDSKTLRILAELSAQLSVTMEVLYLPNDADIVLPDAVEALREAEDILFANEHPLPEELVHWLGKIDQSRRD